MFEVIGLAGRAGVGKDTCADVIQTLILDRFYSIVSFAGPIKSACQGIFGWTTTELTNRELKEKVDPFFGFSPRKAMQILGTEFGRNLDQNVWIKILESKIVNEHLNSVIVTDVRFENEASWIRENHGILIHVDSNETKEIAESKHASEAGLKREATDYSYHNKFGGLENLKTDLKQFLNTINKDLHRGWNIQ